MKRAITSINLNYNTKMKITSTNEYIQFDVEKEIDIDEYLFITSTIVNISDAKKLIYALNLFINKSVN